jgi:hypothetical protein
MHIKDGELVAELSKQLDGEQLLAAAYVRVHTSLTVANYLGPLGNYLIARPAARSAARKVSEETDFPLAAAMVFGISADALHIWRADPMLNQVTDNLGHIPLEKISAFAVTAGQSWQPFTVTLADGHAINLEGRGSVFQIETEFNRLKAA